MTTTEEGIALAQERANTVFDKTTAALNRYTDRYDNTAYTAARGALAKLLSIDEVDAGNRLTDSAMDLCGLPWADGKFIGLIALVMSVEGDRLPVFAYLARYA